MTPDWCLGTKLRANETGISYRLLLNILKEDISRQHAHVKSVSHIPRKDRSNAAVLGTEQNSNSNHSPVTVSSRPQTVRLLALPTLTTGLNGCHFASV